jgi:poly-gamma-glutamate synthesis protein (capsule biosynthesis protein)
MQMRMPQNPWRAGLFVSTLAIVVALSLSTMVGRGQSVQSGQTFAEPLPQAPRDIPSNLAMKITTPFTVTAVGDVMIKRPAVSIEDPQFQDPIRILKNADVTFGNMEGNLADLEHFDGPLRGMMGDKDVAPALKAMGFDLMNRANNHIFDSDRESMFSTMEQLDKVGIVHAGTGKNLEDARRPRYFDSAKGRVGLVGMHTPNGVQSTSSASYASGNVGGRPGLNALDYTVYYNVTADELKALKEIRRTAYTPPAGTTNVTRLGDPAAEPADRVELFGLWYKVGTPGTRSFEMNGPDLREILRSIRNGKYLSEFMIATCHCHQGPILAQQWLFEDQIPDFLPTLARATIDNGADMFVGHGPHVLRGIEIYKGKPIFYGLGEFYYQWQHFDAALMSGSWPQTAGAGGPAGRGARGGGAAATADADANVDVRVSTGLRPINFESMVTETKYDKGQLVEIRLYPTSGGWDGPISQLGMPKTAPPAMAQRILARVQELSKPFGTTIAIENNVGVIRVNATQTGSSARRQ